MCERYNVSCIARLDGALDRLFVMKIFKMMDTTLIVVLVLTLYMYLRICMCVYRFIVLAQTEQVSIIIVIYSE